MVWYAPMIVGVALERLAELVVSKRNLVWSRAHGGSEFGKSHYAVMVTALVFSVLNAALMRTPIKVENTALASLT
jgi:methyltransferase